MAGMKQWLKDFIQDPRQSSGIKPTAAEVSLASLPPSETDQLNEPLDVETVTELPINPATLPENVESVVNPTIVFANNVEPYLIPVRKAAVPVCFSLG